MVPLNAKKQLNGSINESFEETLARKDVIIASNIKEATYPAMQTTSQIKNMNLANSSDTERISHAILLKEVVASYGRGKAKKIVLDNLNMEVIAGKTFALLGPSGCGKTSLLSCAIGRKTVDSGSILVLGGKPGDRRVGLPGAAVGYMPQEICLYGEFSIKETLAYFGRIYGMSSSQVEDRLEFLSSLLELPGGDRRVWSLSGGQKRRVSLSVALLHSPPLLILDEPTVGVDPLVRRNIWEHLTGLARAGVTVVMTTHYIEEARGADTAAIMRNGRVLVQENPDVLLQEYGCATLEKVFLSLCTLDTSEKTKSTIQNVIAKEKFEPNTPFNANGIFAVSYKKTEMETGRFQKNNNENYSKCYREKYSKFISMNNLTALLIKNLTRMVRNVPMLLFIFLLPAIFIVFFCTAVGRDPQHLVLAISYPDQHHCSLSSPNSTCLSHSMACVFLTFLNSSSNISPVLFSNKSTAIQEVKEGKAWGALHIPNNFSSKFLQMFPRNIDSFSESIDVSLDMSNQQIAFVLQKSLSRAFEDTIDHLSSACHIKQINNNLKILHYEDPIFGSTDPSFTDFLAPGIVVLIIYFLAMSLTGEAFIIERSEGLLERSWIAGVRPGEILASYIISQFLVMIIQTTVTLLTIIFIFSIPCRGSAFALTLLTILQGLAGMSFGFFISTISDDILIAMKLAIGSFFPNLLLSGIIWPVEGMPVLLQELVWFLPSTATVQAMRDVMGRGWGLGASSVYTGAIISSGWIIIFLVISWIMVKVKL